MIEDNEKRKAHSNAADANVNCTAAFKRQEKNQRPSGMTGNNKTQEAEGRARDGTIEARWNNQDLHMVRKPAPGEGEDERNDCLKESTKSQRIKAFPLT
jgi:hypothetical protein